MKPMSNELKAMLARPRTTVKSGIYTRKNYRLEAAANRRLAKAGFFPAKELREEVAVEANAIGINGNLRPTWQGRP